MLRRALLIIIVSALLVGGSLLPTGSAPDDPATATAAGGSAPASLSFQPELGLPASDVAMVGVAPGEDPGAAWAVGRIGEVPALVGSSPISGPALPQPGLPVLLRRQQGQGWQVVPVVDSAGDRLGFTDSPKVNAYQPITYDGGIALLGENAAHEQTLITRAPGGSFATAPVPPNSGAEAVLGTGEQPDSLSSPLAVALDEAGAGEPARTGALVVPAPASGAGGATLTPGVLHYDGTRWTREPLCASYSSGASCAVPESSNTSVLALSASAPGNAWLLASIAGSEGASLALFRRVPTGTGGFVWVQPSGWSFDSGLPSGTKAVPLSQGAMLTVTSAGVWVDAAVQVKGAAEGNASRLFSVSSPSTALGTWCYPSPQTLCGSEAHSLGATLPSTYQSVAWPGTGGEPGTRIITGSEHGVLLTLRGTGDFQYTVGAGRGEQGAFLSPTEGWLSNAATVGEPIAGAQVVHVTTAPEPSQLAAWPVPFRRPLLAVAAEPGTTPGEPGAQALAVGDLGQIARYVPGEGWTPEFLYNAAGVVQTPRLRGVAWPEPGRAYAVGDEGAMWLWQSDTGLWESDPAKPVGFSGNLNAIAFDPSNPTIGYAVGKQGVLLSYDKTWEQLDDEERERLEGELKVEEQHLNFTSVAFAGEEALATYRMMNAAGTQEIGGMVVKTGPLAHWEVDKGAQALLSALPSEAATVLSKVAGLPDGGAVAAGPGLVIECDSECGSSHSPSPWRFSSEPLPEAQNVDALAAISEGASVRALISIDVDGLGNPNQNGGTGANPWITIDDPVAPGFGQPPVQIGPDPLPVSGYLLRETSTGWQDLEHQAYPNPDDPPPNLDEPAWPDAVLALDVAPSGQEGWVVGGQTGGIVQGSTGAGGAVSAAQTAAAMRLGSGPTLPQSSGATISAPPGQATFAVGGDAQCASSCANFANEGLGPDVWLSAALARAAEIPGLRGFLYTGTHVAEPAPGAAPLGADEFARELAQYRDDLSAGGAMPVYPAVSTTDVQPHGGGLAAFDSTILGGGLAGAAPDPADTAAYSFESAGGGGKSERVRVIVLDYSGPQLAPGELGWLTEQLQQAKSAGVPAIVMGSANLVEPEADNYALDAPEVTQALLRNGASAYLFDSPGANRYEPIGSGSESIPAFGAGTLGYVLPSPRLEESLGSSGFLLTSVDVAQRNPDTNRAPVTATLIPNIAQLGLDASDGTLLRRSQVALFEGLARLPQAGFELAGGLQAGAEVAPEPYVPIPEVCKGADCAQFIAPSYSFSSSEPDIGQFVEPEPNNSNPRAVLQGPDGKAIPDEPRNEKGEPNADGRFEENAKGEPVNEKGEAVPRAQSGLFCAYNAGTTTVSITTGGLTYSEPVTVQAGSVEQPCGTVPLKNPPPAASGVKVPPTPLAPGATPASSPTPVSFAPPAPPSPVPTPPVVKPAPLVAPHTPTPPAFFVPPAPLAGVGAALLTTPPLSPRPIPPSGTSPVFQTAVAPEEETEEEEATEGVHNMAAYRPEDPNLPPAAPLALIVVAAAAGVGVRRASRAARGRRAHAFAHVTASAPRRR